MPPAVVFYSLFLSFPRRAERAITSAPVSAESRAPADEAGPEAYLGVFLRADGDGRGRGARELPEALSDGGKFHQHVRYPLSKYVHRLDGQRENAVGGGEQGGVAQRQQAKTRQKAGQHIAEILRLQTRADVHANAGCAAVETAQEIQNQVKAQGDGQRAGDDAAAHGLLVRVDERAAILPVLARILKGAGRARLRQGDAADLDDFHGQAVFGGACVGDVGLILLVFPHRAAVAHHADDLIALCADGQFAPDGVGGGKELEGQRLVEDDEAVAILQFLLSHQPAGDEVARVDRKPVFAHRRQRRRGAAALAGEGEAIVPRGDGGRRKDFGEVFPDARLPRVIQRFQRAALLFRRLRLLPGRLLPGWFRRGLVRGRDDAVLEHGGLQREHAQPRGHQERAQRQQPFAARFPLLFHISSRTP